MSEFADALLHSAQTTTTTDDTEVPLAAIYARTSSTNQQFGYSLDEQVRQCVNRCEMLDWTVAFIFQDEAVSGKDTDRPRFQQMLAFAEDGAFDVLVFWKLDRFSRSIMHAVRLENQFREWGVALHSVTEQLDTTTAAGQFNFRNIANAAEFERGLIKQRTKMGHRARILQHKWPNSTPPIGYEKQSDGRLRVLPREAILVRRIFKLYLELESMREVADVLNREANSRPRGRGWSASSIGAVLRNTIYAGMLSVGGIEVEATEYQVIGADHLERAEALRGRYQRDKKARRSEIPRESKRQCVSDVVDAYVRYIEGEN